METLAKGVIGALLLIASAALWGNSVVLGWEWFVVPLGVAPLTFWHVYGLSALGSLWRMHMMLTIDRIHAKVVDGGQAMAFSDFASRTVFYMSCNAFTLGVMYLFKAVM